MISAESWMIILIFHHAGNSLPSLHLDRRGLTGKDLRQGWHRPSQWCFNITKMWKQQITFALSRIKSISSLRHDLTIFKSITPTYRWQTIILMLWNKLYLLYPERLEKVSMFILTVKQNTEIHRIVFNKLKWVILNIGSHKIQQSHSRIKIENSEFL